MRVVLFGAAIAVLFSSAASAQLRPLEPLQPLRPFGGYQAPQAPRTTHAYDWQSGNSYTTTRRPDGSSSTNGVNMQNGTVWNSQTDRRGNSSGLDGSGNFWTYNPQTGTYINSNGTVCTGTGYGRVCN